MDESKNMPLFPSNPLDQNFFFLVFYSNPQTERVYIYVDGDEHRVMLNHDRFLNLIIELAGYAALPDIHRALSTYGTFWIYDRDTNTVRRIAVSGTDDIKTIQAQIQTALKREMSPAHNPINPAEDLAYSPLNMNTPINKKNIISQDEEVANPLTITIKRK